MTALDYLEKISMAREELEGQAILDAITGNEPDTDYIEQQRKKIAEYNRKISEMREVK